VVECALHAEQMKQEAMGVHAHRAEWEVEVEAGHVQQAARSQLG
jgi:hypothetical protein